MSATMSPSYSAVITWGWFLWFIVKHYVADFPLQKHAWLYANKGIYWHPGGWVHAGIHGVLTLVVFAVMSLWVHVSFWLALLLALSETGVHHHIDWWKMDKNKRMGWGPTTHDEFWILLGQDQMLHYLTYAAIILLIILW